MRIQLEKYRSWYLTQEELCVAAAFLDRTCLYGISNQWMYRQEEPLRDRVLRVEKEMEKRGWILPEFDGTVRMEPGLHGLLKTMGEAEKLARIRYDSDSSQGKLYLYQSDTGLAFMQPDLRGGCFLGMIPSMGALVTALEDVPVKDNKNGQTWDLFDQPVDAWISILVFEKQGSFYETVLDGTWIQSGDTDLPELWNRTCRLFGTGSAKGGGQ